MVRHATPPLFAAALAILLIPTASKAQNRSGGTTGGLGGSSFSASSFGASGFGGSSFGASSFGGSGFGGSTFGQSGFGGGSNRSFGSGGIGNVGTAGTATFVGRGVETVFVGRGSGLQQLTTNEGQQRSSRSSGGSDSDAAGGRRPDVRVRLTASPELLARTRRQQLSPQSVSRLRNRNGLAGVSVVTVDGVTRLDGVVETESQRLLAEKLLAIEPGVGRIENRLLLAGSVEEIPPATR